MMSIAIAARWRDKMQISQFRFDAALMTRVGFGSALAVISGRRRCTSNQLIARMPFSRARRSIMRDDG